MKLTRFHLILKNVSNESRRPISFVSVAKNVREDYPDLSPFLLESAGGPRVDTQQSILGLGVLLSVEVRDGLVSVDGERDLTKAIEVHLSGRDRAVMTSSEVMDLIRTVEASGEVVWPDGLVAHLPLLTIVGYDALAPRAPRGLVMSTPELVIIVPKVVVTVNHWTNSFSIMALSGSRDDGDEAAEKVIAAIRKNPAGNLKAASDDLHSMTVADSIPVDFTVTADEYLEHARICMEHILAGDIYQIQLGHEVLVKSGESPVLLYERLRKRNPSPYMFLITVPSVTLAGASPELFVRIEPGFIQMRPLAGTLPKTADSMRISLSQDPKEQAEHIMLVDLCRNDLGRVAKIGSVQVPQLIAVEEFPAVYHLASSIVGELRENLDVWDVIEACFPAGTVTGTPKTRATEIIAELEWTRRGLYAGSVLYSNGHGSLVSALIIRTLVVRDGWVSVRASAGIVSDSDLGKEWKETLVKIQSSLAAVTSVLL